MINAVLLATTPKDERELINGNNKAFNRIGDRYVFEYVLDALYSSHSIDNILVVGPGIVKNVQEPVVNLENILSDYRAKHDRKKITLFAEFHKGRAWQIFLANVQSAYGLAKEGNKSVLFASSDIPLAKGEHIDDFVTNCMQYNLSKNDFYYCIINNRITTIDYPGHIRPGYKLTEGSFRPANLVLLKPSGIKNMDIFAKAFIGTRKLSNIVSKLKLAHYVGYAKAFEHIIKYISGRANISDVESAIGRAMGARLKFVETKYSELEYDIDDSNDYYELKRRLESSIVHKYAKKPSSSLF